MIRVEFSNYFEKSGIKAQNLKIFSMDSNVTISGGEISYNNQLVTKDSLPTNNQDIDIIQATSDSLLIIGNKILIYKKKCS